MKATTHTEVYRPFEGELRPHPLRFLTITLSGIRNGFKKKLPALLLFVPPAISCIVGCFLVHLKFSLESGDVGGISAQQGRAMQTMSEDLFDVGQIIADFVTRVRVFALLAIAWYGSGLISEDRRVGAHLLYFSRPITRLDYILGKAFAAAFYGACTLVVPVFLICSVASFSSPDWIFLTEKWDLILKALAYCFLWVAILVAIVLCISSLVERKNFALVGVFAVLFLSGAIGNVLAELLRDDGWRLISVFDNFARIGDWMLDRRGHRNWPVGSSFWALGVVFAVSIFVLGKRIKRMEVVA